MDAATEITPVRCRRPERDLKILGGLLASETHAGIAGRACCSPRTVRRVRADNDGWLHEQGQRLQEIAVGELEAEMQNVMRALVASAKDTESRTQPQAARVAGELAGIIGKNVTHIGDVYLSQNLLSVQFG